MNLKDLMEQTPTIEVRIPNFEDTDKILTIVSKAIEFWQYYIEQWCENCKDWKIKVKSDWYPWYTTHDCECVVQNKYINDSLASLKKIDNRELLKYNYNWYIWKRPWKEYLFNILDSTKKWFYFHGEPWVWKTYSAYIMLYMYSINNSVFAESLQSVLEDSRPPNEWFLYKQCESVDILVLDDIWREKMSEWVENKLFDLLNKRDKRNLVTIFTSNIDMQNLKSSWDLALKSRFLGNCNKIQLNGEDKRVS